MTATIVVALATISACSSDDKKDDAAATSAPAAASEAKKVKIGFSQANNGDVWRVNQTNNVEDACKKIPNADVVVTDAAGKDEKQAADVDDLISQKVDVLLLTPNTSDALTPAAKKAMDAGIPVITLDRGVETPVTQHIGADNKLIGEAAGKYVVDTLKGKNIIEIQGTLGASATTDRHDKFVEYLKANSPDTKILESPTAKYRKEDALKVMDDLLQKYKKGDFDVVYAHNDDMALGAIQALKTAGRLGEAKVVSIDGANAAFDAIKAGDMAVTFTYDNAGKEGCESAGKLINGEKLDEKWVLKVNQIDSTNVDEWIGKGF